MAYKRIACALLLFTAACLVFPAAGWAIGLEVDPVEINLTNVPLGERIAISEIGREKMKLVIENKSDSAYTYAIKILDTTLTNAPLKRGFQNIPNISWITPAANQIRISANSTKTADLYIEIPKNREYRNKNYQAIVEVKSKKKNPQDLFVLAVQIRICFSTAKMEVKR